MHGGKSGREYFERTANIEIGTGDEILIFASSETIFKKAKKSEKMKQRDKNAKKKQLLERKVVQCLYVHLASRNI